LQLGAHCISPDVLACIRSAAVLGIAAYDVTVEGAAGLPAWTIVGLALSADKEDRWPAL
jgi:hypothetical protein